MKRLLIALCFVLSASPVYSADVELAWDASAGATGYKVYMSTDSGLTWNAPVDVGNVLAYVYLGAPDVGLILFRVSAYNTQAESVRYWSGAWYNEEWKPVLSPGGLGIGG